MYVPIEEEYRTRLNHIHLIASEYVEKFFGVGIEGNTFLSPTGRVWGNCMVQINVPSLEEKYVLFREKMWEFPWPEEPIWYKNVIETVKGLRFCIYFDNNKMQRWQWVNFTESGCPIPCQIPLESETFIVCWGFYGSFTVKISRNQMPKQPSSKKKKNKKTIRSSETYRQYLLSEHWRNLREEFGIKHKKICSLCGHDECLQLHHKSYEHLGCEPHDDLTWLCKNCHEFVHHILSVSENEDVLPGNVIEKLRSGEVFMY